ALPDEPGEHFIDALSTVQDGQVGTRQTARSCLDERRQLLDEAASGNQLLVARPQRGGLGFVGIGLALGGYALCVSGGIGLYLRGGGSRLSKRRVAVGLGLSRELGLVAVGFGNGALTVSLGIGRPPDLGLKALCG